VEQLSKREARRLALQAQGLSRPRPRRATRAALRQAIEQIGVLQLDAVNVVARTQELVPFSRVGPYDPADLRAMGGPGGELFEYWGHAASLLPLALHPLLRWRMDDHRNHQARGPAAGARWRAYLAEQGDEYVDAVLAQVRERGPLPASALDDPRPRQGEWWGRRSTGRQVLEWLFASGQLAAWRSATFERVYDLPERVLPADVLAAPTPTREEAQRALALLAVGHLGVGTAVDIAWYHYLRPAEAKARIGELVATGQLETVAVEGWSAAAYWLPGATATRPTRRTATLLSPFDPLLWQRERTSRLFGFDFTIEIYVPAPKRVYGYYVLPLLLGDELVGRLDLKADRTRKVLLVRAAHAEPGMQTEAVAAAAAEELTTLARFLRLDGYEVAPAGSLAPALRAAGV
jgi:uncharacterized protein YcaQ